MRALTLLATTALALTLTGCGAGDPSGTEDPGVAGIGAPSSTGSDAGEKTDEDAVASTLADAETFAVTLEGVFAGSSYPRDLAGAVAAAKQTKLELSHGNRIASYSYDPESVEFRLCVENTSGAFATYDTQPMSMRQSGASGGCPTE